ncbi:MAG: hypothetical protein ACFFEN_12455 [Candidatus Thorarchaeota archaeon]
MAGLTISSVAEFNTIITMLGCMCATVQAATGTYSAYYKKKPSLLKTNDRLFRAHRAFGGFATTLYFLGLFAGTIGFLGGVFFNDPPFEINDLSYNFHVWPSFGVFLIILTKTVSSYFKKPFIYKNCKWLGAATFIAWSYTWITSAFSYYLRLSPLSALPPGIHPLPTYLLALELLWIQLLIPFIFGGLIGFLIVVFADKLEKKKTKN